jgi:hypothetical protein
MATRVLLDVKNSRNGSISKNRKVAKLLSGADENTRPYCFMYAGWLWQIEHEIRFWLREHVKKTIWLRTDPSSHFHQVATAPDAFYLDFEDPTEALLFKLTWGGR